jgi:hypothetical protein
MPGQGEGCLGRHVLGEGALEPLGLAPVPVEHLGGVGQGQSLLVNVMTDPWRDPLSDEVPALPPEAP